MSTLKKYNLRIDEAQRRHLLDALSHHLTWASHGDEPAYEEISELHAMLADNSSLEPCSEEDRKAGDFVLNDLTT